MDDALHAITLFIRYNNHAIKTFIWKGVKLPNSRKEICHDIDNSENPLFVDELWIRQWNSNSSWFAKAVKVQNIVGSNAFTKYGLGIHPKRFWTDG